jgi:localization factor PodJL
MAEDLARRSGLSLNEWVSRLMAEGPEDATSQDYFSQSSTPYIEAPRPTAEPRYEAMNHPADEIGRVTQAMERLSDRIESAENRQALAISGIERSVREVIGRMESAEREQMHAATRLEGELQAVKSETAQLSSRLRQTEDRVSVDPRTEDALRGVEDALERIEAAERVQAQIAARFEGDLDEVKSAAFALTQRLARVEDEAAGPRSAEALRALETAIGTVAGHVYDGEKRSREAFEQLRSRMDQLAADDPGEAIRELRAHYGELSQHVARLASDTATASAVDELKDRVERLAEREDPSAGAVQALMDNYDGLRERLERLADREDPQAGAIQALLQNYDALRERMERFDGGEHAAGLAIAELKEVCGRLDARLSLAERGASEGVERAAAEMSARVSEVREELGRQLAAAADARFDRVEHALQEMSDHVRAAEERSAGAMERMGRDVLDVAQSLSRRVQAAEALTHETAARVSADVDRVTTAVEDRLARADSLQAQALEKLGGEIARITERLADRIANAERRSAQAIDDVGATVTRVTERINQRTERTASELVERIRQSEERTAKLLEEAREKLDGRLAETQRRIAETAARAPIAPTPHFGALDAADDADDGLFGSAEPFPGFETPPAEQPFPAAVAAIPPKADASPFDDSDFDAASPFTDPPSPFADALSATPPEPAPVASMPMFASDLDEVELEPNVGFDVDDEWLSPSGSRPVAPTGPASPTPADDAPAATRRAEAAAPEPQETAAPLTTREVIERARAAARAASDNASRLRAPIRQTDESVLQGLSSFGRTKRRAAGPPTALAVASVLAAAGLAAGGYMYFEGKPGGRLPKRVADALSVVTGDTAAPADASAPPMAAMALAPKADAGGDLAQAYAAAVQKVTGKLAGGLGDIRKLADGGYAPAQFYLGELYQDGKAGLKKDPTESRRWLEKAAQGGDRTAMHNLALDEHEGLGGPRDTAGAAEWFRRAAELGLLDSQFNLAAIYEHGDGVSANPAEAYKWYLIAGRNGDAEARAGALRVRAGLTPDARAVAERAAAEFQPTAPSPATASAPTPAPAATTAVSPDIVTAQRAMNQLGYYQGPTDGVTSEALQGALRHYQSDQGLPITGAPDAATIAKLSVYTR